jgi:hypothetical protein
MNKKRAWQIAVFVSLLWGPILAAAPNWVPDVTFKATSLAGWHTLGQADWRVQNGEVIGTAKPGGYGGWLVLDHSYQDAALYALFRCNTGCQTGVLLRAEKTAEGWKGIYVSLTDGDVACYRVTLDADGKELQREKLPPAPTSPRILPPLNPAGDANRGAGSAAGRLRRGGFVRVEPAADLSFTPPKPPARSADWNSVETMIDENSVRAWVNNIGDGTIGRAEEENGHFGPIALYVGGTGEVRFKDIQYKDLAIQYAPPEHVSSHFRKQTLNELYYSWSGAVADFNHDGILDVASGPYIYFGPDYSKSREIYPAHTWDASTQLPNECGGLEYAYDFTGDGWPDIVCTPGTLYVNPRGESRRWDKYQVFPPVMSEVWTHADIDGDGKQEMVYMSRQGVVWAKPDPANPTGPWVVHNVSGPGYALQHGLGVGDINGDGRPDIVNPFGWWENPGPGGKEPWTYHPVAFSRYERDNMGSGGGLVGNMSLGNGLTMMAGGALMAVYDVNGDGLNDVVTAISAHGFGLSWFEQKRDAAGNISFVEHPIMKDYSNAAKNAGGVTFSEAHALGSADIDGDGVPDIIVGKRYWSHNDSLHDPDAYGPPVLYWYRTVRNPKAPGGAEFVPELIHNRSGVGSTVVAADLNHDGAMDIVTATDRGTFIFWGTQKGKRKTSARASAARK